MRLLLDEQISPRVAIELRRRGHDVIAVAERADLIGHSDTDITVAAATARRTIVTENISDFVSVGSRRLPNMQPHFGVVLLPRWARHRSRTNLGPLVRSLVALLNAHPRDDELVELVIWLPPADDDEDVQTP